MQEIRQDNEILVGYRLENEVEIDTLDLSINTYLNGVVRQDITERVGKDDGDKFIIGYIIAEELIDDLRNGIRVLASEPEFYIAKVSLQYFLNFFEYSAREKVMSIASKELGVSEDMFVMHAITGLKMLRQLPKFEEEGKTID